MREIISEVIELEIRFMWKTNNKQSFIKFTCDCDHNKNETNLIAMLTFSTFTDVEGEGSLIFYQKNRQYLNYHGVTILFCAILEAKLR